ncbi:MFS transporter [Rhodococcus sp. KBW08]|nr:MFS transporter [Rhodococcus sp. KBW08]
MDLSRSTGITAPPSGGLAIKTAAVVGFLIFVEFTSGFVQGFYVPMFSVMAEHWGISDADITWFNSVQDLAACICVPVLAKLGDIFGHRRVLRIAIVSVLVGTLITALTSFYPAVLVGRLLVGPLLVWLPLEIALVHNRLTRDSARKAIGMLVSALTIGIVAGTLSAGAFSKLTDSVTLMLLIPCLIIALCVVVVFTVVPESTTRTNPHIDGVGFAGLGLVVAGVFFGLSQAQRSGFGSPAAWIPLVSAVLTALVWARWELTTRAPAVDLRVMSSRSLWPVYLFSFIFGICVAGTQTIRTTFLAARPEVSGFGFSMSPAAIGLVAASYAVLATMTAAGFAYFAKSIGLKGVLISGVSLIAVSDIIMVFWNHSLPLSITSVMLAGAGAGFVMSALPTIVAEAAPDDQTGIATGLSSTLKTLGGAAAGAGFAMVLASFTEFGAKRASLGGYETVWIVCTLLLFLCPILLWFLPTHKCSRDDADTTDPATATESESTATS